MEMNRTSKAFLRLATNVNTSRGSGFEVSAFRSIDHLARRGVVDIELSGDLRWRRGLSQARLVLRPLSWRDRIGASAGHACSIARQTDISRPDLADPRLRLDGTTAGNASV
jgi:hypothetical protein